MRIAGTIFAMLLTLVYIPAAAAAAILFAAQAQLYTPSTYETLLDRNRFYERVPVLIVGNYIAGGSFPGLTSDKAERMVQAIMPKLVLRETAEPAIAQLVTFARGESGEVTIDLTRLKETARVNVPGALDVAHEGLADCTPAQVQAGLARRFECRPAADDLDQLTRDMQAMVNIALDGAPNISVLNLERESAEFNAEQRRQAHLGMKWGPLLPLAIFSLIAAFVIRSWSAALLWFAIPTLIAGFAVAAIGLVSQSLLPGAVQRQLMPDNSSGTDPADVLAAELATDLASVFSTGTMLAGGVLALAAIAALFAMAAVRKAAAPPGSGYY